MAGNTRPPVCLLLFVWLIVVTLEFANAAIPIPKPNIILFLADDLGYGEVNNDTWSFPIDPLSPGGGKPLDRSTLTSIQTIRTPNLLRAASQGVILPSSYAGSALCTPSRMSILQERHAGAFGVRGNKENEGVGVDQDVEDNRTFVHELRDAGYQTGVVGKWRIGSANGAPWNQGFNLYFGMDFEYPALMFPPFLIYYNSSIHTPPATLTERALNNRWQIPENKPKVGYNEANCPKNPKSPCKAVHDLVRAKALQFIDENRDRPFFLFWSNPAPHAGFYSTTQLKKRIFRAPVKRLSPFRVRTMNECSRGHASQVEQHLDQDVKALLELLEASPTLDQRTLIVFTSDNGAHSEGIRYTTNVFHSTGGLNGQKGTMFEGGLRVPTILRWPGTLSAGTINYVPHSLYDLGPTFREVAGLPVVLKNGIFGEPGGARSMLQTWLSKEPTRGPDREWLHFELCRKPQMVDYQCSSATIWIRDWDNSTAPVWKFMIQGAPKPSDVAVRLFDLRSDPQELAEVRNRSDILQWMRNLHNSIRSNVDDYRALLPWPKQKKNKFPSSR